MPKPFTATAIDKSCCYSCKKKFKKEDKKIPLVISGFDVLVHNDNNCLEEAVFKPIKIEKENIKLRNKIKKLSLYRKGTLNKFYTNGLLEAYEEVYQEVYAKQNNKDFSMKDILIFIENQIKEVKK